MAKSSTQKLIARERSMEHGPKTKTETALEQKISQRLGKPYKGKR